MQNEDTGNNNVQNKAAEDNNVQNDYTRIDIVKDEKEKIDEQIWGNKFSKIFDERKGMNNLINFGKIIP